MQFQDMNFKLENTYNTINVTPEHTIKVLKYLPIKDKNDLIQVALQKADEGGYYNPLKVQMYFELFIVYMYTDLEFTVEEKANDDELYDILKSNGIIGAVLNTMTSEELNWLYDMLYQLQGDKEKYRSSISAVISGFMDNLVPNTQEAAEIIKNFNPEQFQQVLNFAKAANGGRDI